ncbi:hydrolase 1, exosortase A system-associated [Niveibacterium umoris]|uniref:Exosortase A-associated hydrolase 1 n=1 Tax=Niveibacterium umoris TaxID=1193620 RepID=A0A840BI61_9RHOO|nr:hydrolase 1, exosortase A system-associated [Niveibacterium umoris]MBB4012313.1 exosortase A-associated hydrolase 1 [Niveibacterium umoris]
MIEDAILLDCAGDAMPAIVTRPDNGTATVGVLVIVGGPQTRVGSHRQFVLLARALAAAGLACLRFDYRGMGDASGAARDFEQVDDDIGVAVAGLKACVPGIEKVVLWGLCDGATAAAFHAAANDQITGLVMLNPWVRSEAGEAAALVSSYYGKRVFSLAFWSKFLSGKLDFRKRAAEFIVNLRKSRGGHSTAGQKSSLPDRLGASLQRYRRPVLLILSGNDLTAAEFISAAHSGRLAEGIKQCDVTRRDLQDANHTFSSLAWRRWVESATVAWIAERIDPRLQAASQGAD